ncbi:Uncharacterised protein [Klebsiella pneumoniae subsp. pneumoniae]|uniref:Uncharacterized protein n=1 Tax=Klebsiella pneumoniae subsp. pneumoniae TaxID=72407 RepID=A0A377YW40_KLEPN|nr:Uncharacterised protein [Klebsiella pneumoniae subsp. pneumoniae]
MVTNKGPFEIRKNLELASGDILYRESGIYDSTLGLLDFGDTWSGAGKTAGYQENDQIKNLCYVDDYAARTYRCRMMATVSSLQSTTVVK